MSARKSEPVSEKRCQHRLKREYHTCEHGYAMGATCSKCMMSCPECWDLYASAASYCKRSEVSSG